MQAYVVFTCGQNSAKSMETHSAESEVWKSDHVFEIIYGNENLEIELYDAKLPPQEGPQQKYRMSLDNFKDQNKHDEWIQLRNLDDSLSETRLHLNIHWVYSTVDYLTKLIAGFDHSILEEQKNYFNYIDDLNALYEPFMALQTQQIVVQGPQKSPYNPDPAHKETERAFKKSAEIDKTRMILTVLGYMTMIWFVMNLCNCYLKSSFLDLMLSLLYLSSIFLEHPTFNTANTIVYIVAICIAFVLDITWLCLYWDAWWSTPYIDDNMFQGLRKFIIIITIINVVIKAVICVLLFLKNYFIKDVSEIRSFDQHDRSEVNVAGGYGGGQGLGIGRIGGEDQHNYNPHMGSNVYDRPQGSTGFYNEQQSNVYGQNNRSGYQGYEMSGYHNDQSAYGNRPVGSGY